MDPAHGSVRVGPAREQAEIQVAQQLRQREHSSALVSRRVVRRSHYPDQAA
jgi:hypothetical protein